MSGGFWAGAVPPWAYATGGCLGILLVLLGVWGGYGRGWKHCEEEQRWAREQAKARRVVYRAGFSLDGVAPEVTHEDRTAWEDQALTLANELPHEAAITTGEIMAITDRVDEWIAKWNADAAG